MNEQPNAADVAGMLLDAAQSVGMRIESAPAKAMELTTEFPRQEGVLAIAAGMALGSAVDKAWRNGWLPVDLWELVRRHHPADGAGPDLLRDVIAADLAQYAAATVHDRWAAQVERLEATVWWEHDRPHLTQWADRRGITPHEALAVAITVLGGLAWLARLPVILPAPGTARRGTVSGAGVDQKVLARVRGLLAKAESTDFPEEADALSAKAQELMNKHAFQRALIDAEAHREQTASSSRLWLDGPYLDAKSRLVAAIAQANRCRSAFYSALGLVVLVGEDIDLEITELLTTSLLVQATRAMVAEGKHTPGGISRTRSFRRAFLFSYAARIGERLTEAAASAHDPAEDRQLLPVLAARSRVVEQTFEALYPETRRRRSVSISNGAGWNAGRAAADRAGLTIERRAVTA